jgi:hypothetical protein
MMKRIFWRVIRDLRANRVVFIECDKSVETFKDGKIFFRKRIGEMKRSTFATPIRAQVVLGILHRVSLKIFSLSGANRCVGPVSVSSIGAGLLKVFEQYVWQHPDRWYQWKNFSEVAVPSSASLQPAESPSLPALRTAPSSFQEV